VILQQQFSEFSEWLRAVKMAYRLKALTIARKRGKVRFTLLEA